MREKKSNWKNKYCLHHVTVEEVVWGELILDEGDPPTKINLDKSIAKIKARNLFKNVKYEVLDGKKIIWKLLISH